MIRKYSVGTTKQKRLVMSVMAPNIYDALDIAKEILGITSGLWVSSME